MCVSDLFWQGHSTDSSEESIVKRVCGPFRGPCAELYTYLQSLFMEGIVSSVLQLSTRISQRPSSRSVSQLGHKHSFYNGHFKHLKYFNIANNSNASANDTPCPSVRVLLLALAPSFLAVRWSRLIFHISSPSPRICQSSRSPGSFGRIILGAKIWALSLLAATRCLWNFLSWQKNTQTNMNLCVYI